MSLHDFIHAVASAYDAREFRSEGAQILKGAEDLVAPLIPAGLNVRSSRGAGNAAATPWFAVLDPDETDSPMHGMYVVYLFSADLASVTLSLNQGASRLAKQGGWAAARRDLKSDAVRLRQGLGLGDEWRPEFSLQHRGDRPRAYEAASIAAITHSVPDLPSDHVLERELLDFIALYERARDVQRRLHSEDPGSLVLPAQPGDPARSRRFAPKSDADYKVSVLAAESVRTRRHETVVARFGELMERRGHQPRTDVHPIDLEVVAAERWVVEVKIVRDGDSRIAVREAIGQLLEYKHFLRRGTDVALVALFSEPVGEAYVDLLQSLNIEVIWKGEMTWEGTPRVGLDLLSQ